MNTENTPKLLDKNPSSGIAVPIAILLVGALIIFGVTKMLSEGKNYKDLVRELQSKTFGNRWVAAYELSKYLTSNEIPEMDLPWLVENLEQVYDSGDPKTRNFVVLALSSLKREDATALLWRAIDDEDESVRLNAVVGIGNSPSANKNPQWEKLKLLVGSGDKGLSQVAMMTLAQHQAPGTEEILKTKISSSENFLRYSAAVGLILYKNEISLPVIEEILQLRFNPTAISPLAQEQITALQSNVLTTISRVQWSKTVELLEQNKKNIEDNGNSALLQQTLNLLKK